MAKCEFCGKDVSFGIQVSHSHSALTGLGNPTSSV